MVEAIKIVVEKGISFRFTFCDIEGDNGEGIFDDIVSKMKDFVKSANRFYAETQNKSIVMKPRKLNSVFKNNLIGTIDVLNVEVDVDFEFNIIMHIVREHNFDIKTHGMKSNNEFILVRTGRIRPVSWGF